MDFGDYYWLVYLGLFLLMEIPAAVKRPRWTLSHHIWKWFAIGKPLGMNWAWFRWLILAGLTISTTAHFLFLTSAIPIIVFGVGAAWSIYYYYGYESGTPSIVEIRRPPGSR